MLLFTFSGELIVKDVELGNGKRIKIDTEKLVSDLSKRLKIPENDRTKGADKELAAAVKLHEDSMKTLKREAQKQYGATDLAKDVIKEIRGIVSDQKSLREFIAKFKENPAQIAGKTAAVIEETFVPSMKEAFKTEWKRLDEFLYERPKIEPTTDTTTPPEGTPQTPSPAPDTKRRKLQQEREQKTADRTIRTHTKHERAVEVQLSRIIGLLVQSSAARRKEREEDNARANEREKEKGSSQWGAYIAGALTASVGTLFKSSIVPAMKGVGMTVVRAIPGIVSKAAIPAAALTGLTYTSFKTGLAAKKALEAGSEAKESQQKADSARSKMVSSGALLGRETKENYRVAEEKKKRGEALTEPENLAVVKRNALINFESLTAKAEAAGEKDIEKPAREFISDLKKASTPSDVAETLQRHSHKFMEQKSKVFATTPYQPKFGKLNEAATEAQPAQKKIDDAVEELRTTVIAEKETVAADSERKAKDWSIKTDAAVEELSKPEKVEFSKTVEPMPPEPSTTAGAVQETKKAEPATNATAATALDQAVPFLRQLIDEIRDGNAGLQAKLSELLAKPNPEIKTIVTSPAPPKLGIGGLMLKGANG